MRVSVSFTVARPRSRTQQDYYCVVELEPLGLSSGVKTDPFRVPVGKNKAQPISVHVLPGTYVARLRFPSGVHVNEVLTVDARSGEQHIVLGADKGDPLPQAYRLTENPSSLGNYAHTLPSVPRLPIPPKNAVVSVKYDSGLDSSARNILERAESTSDWLVSVKENSSLRELLEAQTFKSNLHLPEQYEIATGTGEIGQIAEFLSGRQRMNLVSTWDLVDLLNINIQDSWLRPIRSTAKKSHHRINVDAAPWDNQAYVVVKAPGFSRFSTKIKVARVPTHWRRRNGLSHNDISVDISKRRFHNFSLSVKVDDPEIQSVLDFSQQMDLESALAVLDRSVKLLFDKVINPSAAAAAGYVLLHAPSSRLPREWSQWIANLANWYPEIPDGRIQYATLLLERSSTRGDRNDFPYSATDRLSLAARLIIDSLSSGLPLYRAGFSLLTSALEILANDSSLEDELKRPIENARLVVNTLRLRIDTSQSFTVLDLSL